MRERIELAATKLPTSYGSFDMYAFEGPNAEQPNLALVNGDLQAVAIPMVRIHSECMTGDVFHSLRCDCGEQLAMSMRIIQQQGGILIYLRQEGRGIGLINKMKAYNLQDAGFDTLNANIQLGFHADERNYSDAVEILEHFGIKRIKLLTNNPNKIEELRQSGIEVVERIPLLVKSVPENKRYLQTKRDAMGHLF
jgi:3,4-dihydroxy 2-butanone 4-phosphate synthase/GTP cyclohydrolase II